MPILLRTENCCGVGGNCEETSAPVRRKQTEIACVEKFQVLVVHAQCAFDVCMCIHLIQV